MEEQEVWLGGDDSPVLEGRREGLRPPVTPVSPLPLLGAVGGSGPGGGPRLSLHRPGRHRDKPGSSALGVGRLQLQSDSGCSYFVKTCRKLF